jgi:uncharacterized short protein YbdD (DUF466 family)
MGLKISQMTGIVLILLTAACNQGVTPVDQQVETPGSTIGDLADPVIVAKLPISTRSFKMGTAGFVPRNYPNSSNDDWEDLLEYGAALHGGIYGIHVAPGEKANEEGILEQAQLAFELMKGVEPYIAFSISHEQGPFSPEQGEELIRVAVANAKKYQPEYLSLGVEINSFYLYQQDTFDLYVQYVREAYDQIKEVSPNTRVMTNFQFDRMRGEASLTGQNFESHWHLIDKFAGKMDLISFTVYPFLEYTSVADIPDDYLAEIREYTSLPVMITETGWPTEDLASGVAGSDQDQIDFLMKLIKQANGIDVEVIIWVFPHDVSFGIAGGIFDHLSFFENDGTPKAGYKYWQAINSLPIN